LEINDLEMQRLKLNNAELRQKIARLDAIAEWVTESGEAEQSKIPEILAPESRATLREPKQRNGETTGAPQKATKPRTHLEPRPDLLVNPDATLSRLRAAEALGIAPRTLDRWVKDKKLTPFGAGLRKRFKAKDLQRAIDQKLSDKRDKK
jgi:Asp-tRNA(Asn)/Glu-tRNA(Gln) amidotransferase C subunit